MKLRLTFWAKLALFGAAGVLGTHAIHLAVAWRVAGGALEQAHLARGQDVARLLADQAVDSVLVDDFVRLQELVETAAARPGVRWCFIEREGRVLATSFHTGTPPGLLKVRSGPDGQRPLVVVADDHRTLDVAAPVLGGGAGTLRLGLDLASLDDARLELALYLSLLAAGMVLAGVAVAALVGGGLARPLRQMVKAADQFDPAAHPVQVSVRGNDEFAELAARFNQMMDRLCAAHARHQATLRQAAASERLVALGALVAGVAHEVNNPLAGLKNIQAALREGSLPPARQRDYVELMGDSLERIQAIVGRLLDFGRPRPVVLRGERLSDLVAQALQLAGPAMKQRGVRLVAAPGEDGFVRADRGQVGQALLNLVLNAAYVTPEGKEVRVRPVLRPGWGGISVEDDGPGIPEDLRDRVLDPFFTTKPEGQGTGLGLSVTRTIVDTHGGELKFAFPASGGTHVTMWLRNSPRLG